jgi:hypothetical protein
MEGPPPRFLTAVGHAALELWPDLSRDMQERLFEHVATADPSLREGLAIYLHNCHPRTAHPPKPTAVA